MFSIVALDTGISCQQEGEIFQSTENADYTILIILNKLYQVELAKVGR
jgi:hypothetical protein